MAPFERFAAAYNNLRPRQPIALFFGVAAQQGFGVDFRRMTNSKSIAPPSLL
jgi:hypothetical protein